MEKEICGEPLQELIEGSFEKPIELQKAIVVASMDVIQEQIYESMDVIQEQIYVPEPPSQPQIQTEKSKPQSEQYPKQQSEQHPHFLLDLRIPKPRAPFTTTIKVKFKNFFPCKNTM